MRSSWQRISLLIQAICQNDISDINGTYGEVELNKLKKEEDYTDNNKNHKTYPDTYINLIPFSRCFTAVWLI